MSSKGNSPSSASPVRGRLFTVGLVTSWYSSNIGVLLLNKYLLSNYGFKFPIFLTMCHMTACSIFSYVAIACLKLVPLQIVRSRLQFLKIAALSLVFCGSVVSGKVSLRYLPVSFNQAVRLFTVGLVTSWYSSNKRRKDSVSRGKERLREGGGEAFQPRKQRREKSGPLGPGDPAAVLFRRFPLWRACLGRRKRKITVPLVSIPSDREPKT